MVYRLYVEKKPEPAGEAAALRNDAKTLLGISGLEDVRIISRYDVEGISRELFDYCRYKVFADPQLDVTADSLRELVDMPEEEDPELIVYDGSTRKPAGVFAVEMLPGLFDQRADSAAQCIQIISQEEKPAVRFAAVYALYGELSGDDIAAVKRYVINPAESGEVSLDKPESLVAEFETPETVEVLTGFTRMTDSQLGEYITLMGLEMDADDLNAAVHYFRDEERRDPTVTELRVIDKYRSDRCRHTTFGTIIDSVFFEDELLAKAFREYIIVRKKLGRTRPVCLMDVATVAVRYLRKAGRLDKLDESGEINACTVNINVEINGEKEPWLLLFKNVTGNTQTETEPYGGAAACLGGCIRDPLSGRAYAYSAMRLTGAADPLQTCEDTLPGKLPQKTITTGAARGFSSYGNQTGLSTGLVDEIYHPGFAAKRMEVAAVLGAAPAFNVRRERPQPGDIVMLLGADTGRDGVDSEAFGKLTRKCNAAEERKMQRFFRNEDATRLIKRCNDLGTGGISTAIGRLADGLEIDLDAVPKRCGDLDGTELALSESQERLACLIAPENKYLFINLAADENLQCVQVATVTEEPRLVMNWNGSRIVDISKEFLRAAGTEKHVDVTLLAAGDWEATSFYEADKTFAELYHRIASDLNTCSKRGLAEMFDSTIGSGTVLMPFGGRNQLTPVQAMVHKIPVDKGVTDDCSMMAWGYNPFISEASPYHGAYLAVVESIAKLIATGASYEEIYLSFQEYFESLGREPEKWGKPLSALLGAFEAQMCLGIGAICGNDSMSGSCGELDVPPSLISFAVTMGKTGNIISPEFKTAGHSVFMLSPEYEESDRGVGRGLPKPGSLVRIWEKAAALIAEGRVCAAYTPGMGGVAEAVMKMTYGNGIGFSYLDETDGGLSMEEIFGYSYGSIILEMSDDIELRARGVKVFKIGETVSERKITRKDEVLDIGDLLVLYEGRLDTVFPSAVGNRAGAIENFSYRARSYHVPLFKRSEPKVLIPVFPGMNGEDDTARAVRAAGAAPDIIMIRSRTSAEIRESAEKLASAIRDTQMMIIPGGFSGGDEPDGAAKSIEAFMRNEAVADAVAELLEKRDGLICGIGNGFQALIRLGLLPYGRIMDIDENCPALTWNTIGQHQSRMVRIRVASNKSPWLRGHDVGEVFTVPVSHSGGKFIASEELIRQMAVAGQIATQYADLEGNASGDVRFNPNGSMYAIEGITSPDGRVFGRMAHAERIGDGLYKNVEGRYYCKMFENAVNYFK